jgi:uncharacterized membrane protein YbhN (UPF0104 family)
MQRAAFTSYLLGLILFAALVGTIAQLGELERFLDLLQRVEPVWLILCMVLQSCTYLYEAIAWRRILRGHGYEFPLSELFPLSVAKLFSDQAMPSAGISGNAFFLSALRRRGVATTSAMSCMLIDLAAYFSSYAASTALSLAVLALHHEASRWLLVLTSIFVVLQMSIPIGLWHIKHRGTFPGQALLARSPRISAWLRTAHRTAGSLTIRSGQFGELAALHAIIIVLDAATLWVILKGIGHDIVFWWAYSSFITASMVMSLSPIPLGLGTFDATCVVMLHAAGVGLEAGLTATILFRGVSVWLPMLPGMWLIRREMRSSQQAHCGNEEAKHGRLHARIRTQRR